jgi:hypothetical protein
LCFQRVEGKLFRLERFILFRRLLFDGLGGTGGFEFLLLLRRLLFLRG